VEKYLSSEKPVFFELRVRYLQACERMQEAMALAKSCLQHPEVGRHLFFHQAYLTCLYKASLHEHLLKEVQSLPFTQYLQTDSNQSGLKDNKHNWRGFMVVFPPSGG
jgi:hypothetical protein